MKTIFSKEDIEQYAKKAKQCMEKCIIEMSGDIDENARDELNHRRVHSPMLAS